MEWGSCYAMARTPHRLIWARFGTRFVDGECWFLIPVLELFRQPPIRGPTSRVVTEVHEA